MAYKLFDRDGNEIKQNELQNKSVWYEHGYSKEQVFVKRFGERFDITLNPEKGIDPSVPDLIYSGSFADLKCQNTPLFMAQRFYGTPADYAVTFNLKDALNYGPWGNNYENFTIFYWVDWVSVRMTRNNDEYKVKQLTGIWKVNYNQLEQTRKSKKIHWYSQRNRRTEPYQGKGKILAQFEPRLVEGGNIWSIRGSGNNAACSYVFDLREFERIV